MSEGSQLKDGADGGEQASPPTFLGLRSRVQNLYRARRRRVLEVPIAELRRRYDPAGLTVEVDEVDHRWARVELDDGTQVEAGFKGTFRLFGALIDTQWVARRGELGGDPVRYDYRFDKQAFVSARRGRATTAATNGVGAASPETLADEKVVELAGRSELKSMVVLDGPDGRQVELIPLAGTITAMYFPPLPPYTVALKANEVRDHVTLLERLLR